MSDNVKIGTFMLKISRLLLLKDFGQTISVLRELDVFVKHRCLWPQQSPYEGKHSARHEYSLLLHTIATRLLHQVVELNFDKRFCHNMGECFFTLENKQWNTFSMSDLSYDLKHRGRI